MLANGPCEQTGCFPQEDAASDYQSSSGVFVVFFRKDLQHFLAEKFPMFGGIQTQKLSIGGSISGLFRCDAQRRQSGDVLHPVDFKLKVAASLRRETVRLAPSGCLLLFKPFDPVIVEKTAQRAIQSPCT